MSKAVVESKQYSIFLKGVSAASNRVLLLDYDGTIAPFLADRRRAVPYPEIPPLLQRIATSCNTRLIIVSGRSAQELPGLLALNPAPESWGTHGLEKIQTDGRHNDVYIDDAALRALDTAEAELESENLAEHVEVKVAAVAVHWRGLAPSQVLNVRTKAYRLLEPLAAQAGLRLAEFDQGVEIRLSAANKGYALEALLSQLSSDIPVAYLGDDSTDEDAFRALNGRGLTVLVRPTYRFTAAQTWLRPPDEVVEFLADWIKACEASQ